LINTKTKKILLIMAIETVKFGHPGTGKGVAEWVDTKYVESFKEEVESPESP
jgi:hypothetical protein